MSLYTPLSFWEKDAWFKDVDVVIVGGGIVGMNAGLKLKTNAPNLSIMILERSAVGTAASSRNAGFSCFGSPSELLDDLEQNTESEVFELVEMRVKGIQQLQKILGKKALDYRATGGYEMFTTPSQYNKHADHLPKLNESLRNIDDDLQFYVCKSNHGLCNISGIIGNKWEGQIHPGRMTKQLAKQCIDRDILFIHGVNVDKVESLSKKVKVQCGDHSFYSKQVIIANNAFANALMRDNYTSAGRNLVMLSEPISDLKIDGCYHYDRGYVYFRNVNDRLLIGGGRNIDLENETTDEFGVNEKIKQYLHEIIQQHILPNKAYTIEHTWSGILGFNSTKRPRVEHIKPNIVTAVGLGGMGVAIGTLIGQKAAELLLQS